MTDLDNGFLGGWVSTEPERLTLSQFYWMGYTEKEK